MDQSDYSFMRSGFDNLENGDEEQKQQQLASTLVHFSENALLNASVYIKHADRNQITKEDLKRCLMLEVFIFTKRENLQEKIEDIIHTNNNLFLVKEIECELNDINILLEKYK